jgi:hypothetical protein
MFDKSEDLQSKLPAIEQIEAELVKDQKNQAFYPWTQKTRLFRAKMNRAL